MSDLKFFSIDGVGLTGIDQCPEFKLGYTVHGSLNSQANNAIVFPTYYTGTHEDNERLIGSGKALDTDQYFIIVPNLFGNGISSSPSNTNSPFDGPRFPTITIHHNVVAQHQLLTYLGVRRLRLAIGWSMGGLQSYHWCVHQPEMVENALIICATAKASTHNRVFLEGVKAALITDQTFNSGNYIQAPESGLKAFARVYAGWAYSQAFFRHKRYRELGFESAEALLRDWEEDHLNHDANDLLCALKTWQLADVGTHPSFYGDTTAALKSIRSRIWLMPCEQDLYFRHEDNRNELAHLGNAAYHGYQSDFGHCSAGPGRFESETALIEDTIRAIL